jgi:uncharacterized heparinase superfamily protein
MTRRRRPPLGPTLRTLGFLRPEQVVARGSFVLERSIARARPRVLPRLYGRRLDAALPTLTDAGPLWRWPPAPLDPAARARPIDADAVAHAEFTFLNQPRQVTNWTSPGASRLWLFHLHGFAYAVDLAVAARRGRSTAAALLSTLVDDWLRAHPIDASDAWHPFVASERLISWLVAADLLPDLRPRLRRPIVQHALFVERHLEFDVAGNHLLKNLVALLLAGCAFDGPASERWRARASTGLGVELERQVLPDGGHYERSPMYHVLVLADLLAGLFPAGRRELPIAVPLAAAVRGMQSAARTLIHPDGNIPLFNDAVLGEAPLPAQVIGPSTVAVACLPRTGYATLRLAEGVLFADCGPPGPDDLPAHVHADALSFELSVGQRRVFVNAGVLDYSPGPMRDALRGTAAHNTVQVDGQEQSEVWAAFRVGRRARVGLHQCTPSTLVASHDGYARLGVSHERRIDAVPGVGWRIQDLLIGRGAHRAQSRLRLHPSLTWHREGAVWTVVDPGTGALLLTVRPFGPLTACIERGAYAERFSRLQQVEVLTLTASTTAPTLFGAWLLLPGAEPSLV